jgi:hypothetical protein
MPVPLVVALGALLAAGSAAAESGSSFEVDFTHLLELMDTADGRRRGAAASASAVVQIHPGETVYSAATRICHEAEALEPLEQAGCVIPLAKWLQQRSANDGRWKVPGEEPKKSPWGLSGLGDWLIRLPRDSARRISANIGAKPPAQPGPSAESCDAAEPLRYGYGKRHCPAADNRTTQLLLQAGPYFMEAGLAARQGLGYFSSADDSLWRARVALHRRQLQRQLRAAAEYPSRLPANIFFQLHYEPTFSCTLEERVGPIMDGGKWICDPPALQHPPQRCLVYSIGSEKDTLFERDMVSE